MTPAPEKPTVLLLETIAPPADASLREHANVVFADTPRSGLSYVNEGPVRAIVTRGKGQVDAALIDGCDSLEVIARCGVGLDNVDVAHASRRGVRVINAPGSNADTVAEHTLALMLMLQRKLVPVIRAVKSNDWASRTSYDGDELRGKQLGILGLGDIGRRVATLAAAFGMDVCYWGRQAGDDAFHFLDLDTLVATSHVISIHLPLTPETRNLLSLDRLAGAKKRPLLINTARGGIVTDAVVLEAINRGYLSGFGADLLEVSPPPANAPLLSLDNVLVTPHAASLTKTTYEEMCLLTVQNTLELLKGRPIDPRFVFNK